MGRHSLLCRRDRAHILHHRSDHWAYMGKTHLECMVDMGSQVNYNSDSLVHLRSLSYAQGSGAREPAFKLFCGFRNHGLCQCSNHLLRHQVVENHTSGGDHGERPQYISTDETYFITYLYRLWSPFLLSAYQQN